VQILDTNVIQLVYNADGSLLSKNNAFIASNNQAANNIQVIAPFPNTDSISVNYYLRNARISNYTQYLRLLRDTEGNSVLGKDIIDPARPYYQTVKDWNVWQIPISSKALRAISKYHAGKVDVSVTIREFKNFLINETMEDKGTFGSANSTLRGDLPVTGAAPGDFYRCDYLDFYSASADLNFTLMDLAIWDGINFRWVKGNVYEEIMTTPSTTVGVDPSIFGTAIEDVEPAITEQILERLSSIEGDLYELSDDFKELIIEQSLSTYIITLHESDFQLYDDVLIAYKQLVGVETDHILLFDSLYNSENIELEVEQVSSGLIRVISTGSETPDDVDIIAVKLSGVVVNQTLDPEPGTGGTYDHRELSYASRFAPNQHPIDAISGLSKKVNIHIGTDEPVETVENWYDVIDESSGVPEIGGW
jgi:hypothetical protein